MAQSPADRAMLLSDGFTGSNQPASADRLLFWTQDTNPAATGGYDTFFLVNAGGTFHFWTKTSPLADRDNDLLFPSQGAFFLRLQNPQPDWRMPRPWQP